MPTIDYANGLAIWELVFFTPALVASAYVCSRHGFMKSSGWIFLVIFCIIRIMGSSAQMATISKNHSSTATTIALVCSAMGLSPLLLSSLGLLSRIYYSILGQVWSMIFQFAGLKIVQTPAAIGLILCIVGATSASDPDDIESQATVKAGIILFLAVFVLLSILTLVAVLCRSKLPEQEKKLIYAVGAALPLILLRIIYSLLAAFSHKPAFNFVTGSKTIALFMDDFPEMLVVVLYVAVGLKVKDTPLEEGASSGRKIGYRLGRGDFGTGKLGILSVIFAILNACSGSNDAQDDEEMGRGKPDGRHRDQSLTRPPPYTASPQRR